MNQVNIIGGGWAGLTTAIYLSHKNIPIQLFEQSKQIGGRGRCIPFGNLRVDYGQHLLFGSHQYTRSILRLLGINEKTCFRTENFKIENYHENYCSTIKYAPLFSPLNILGMLFSKSVFLKDRLSALNLLSKIAANKARLTEDTSVFDYLLKFKQSESMIREFWNPLCSLGLGCQAPLSSAHVFVNFIKQTLVGKTQNSKFYIPKNTLSEIFFQKAIEFIEKKGGTINYNKKIDKLYFTDDRLDSIMCGNETIKTNYLVIATPLNSCKTLIDGHHRLTDLKKDLERLPNQLLRTLYLQYPTNRCLDFPVACLSAQQQYWLFDHSYLKNKGIIAAKLIDNPASPMQNENIITHAISEIEKHFPSWPKPVASLLLEDNNGIQCRPNVNKARPNCNTTISNMFLAGDYINSSLPANLETTVMSGMLCAQKIYNLLSSN